MLQTLEDTSRQSDWARAKGSYDNVYATYKDVEEGAERYLKQNICISIQNLAAQLRTSPNQGNIQQRIKLNGIIKVSP
ncbi:unnamed protein product [Allacma fusca]|uniref:Uncharacterized protein n=1 Tax=Allacma fusca TaxID=39272 RepID=A0A8J2J5L1_9HEXA|nr:unnamed protein product [Allacma fusca]